MLVLFVDKLLIMFTSTVCAKKVALFSGSSM